VTENLYTQLLELIDAGQPCCAVVVLSAEGSTPREAGTRAVVEAGGHIHGTIGGGSPEASVQAAAIEACRSGQPTVLDIQLTGDSAAGEEPICGGRMRILVDPTAAKDRDAYAQAADALAARRQGVLITRVSETGPTRTDVQWLPSDNVPSQRESDASDVLIEPVVPDPLLVIAGGGHVGQALARQARLIGFSVTVVDDRPEFTDPALFPGGVATVCGDIAATLRALPAADDTYIVIVTRGHLHDAEALEACIHRPVAYIGMIGSRRKVAALRESFIEQGAATVEQLDAVHAPIGLDIGAETVPEIATSIAAQLVAVRRLGRAGREPRDMRDR